MNEQQQSASVYREALAWITQHPGTGSANSLAKLVLSLWNSDCAYPVSECLRNLDGGLIHLAVRMVNHYSEHGEDDELRAIGEAVFRLYPRLWDLGQVMKAAAHKQRDAWARAGAAESARLYLDR